MTTIEILLKCFGNSPTIPLEQAAPLWNYKPDTLARKIDEGYVRLPYFRLDDSQKAERLVSLIDLATLIDQRHLSASQEFEKLWD